ncbi:MAG TPA: metallophosphoesterase [Polyangiaceae bacterium]|nr:metallophosphoesterase [Polyangiaceae bacterium]
MEQDHSDSSALLHVSDLHYGCERPEVEAALLELHARLRPALVVGSGDFTQRARHHEYARAARFFERLGPRALLLVPGNHDVPLFQPWERFSSPYCRYSRYLSRELEPTYESEDWLVLGVNSTTPRRIEDGWIAEASDARVLERLARATPRQLRVVVTHQPFHAARPRDLRRAMGRQLATAVGWGAAGLDILLSGHVHVPAVLPLPGSLHTHCVQAGTAVSNRYRQGHPNSVNLLVHTGNQASCRVERYDFTGERFELAETVALPPAPR